MAKKYICSMDGCEEKTCSGLFKIEDEKSYIIPLCDKHFHELIVLRKRNDKKILMTVDHKKLLRIEILL